MSDLSSDLSEDARAMLLAVDVFSQSSWSDFEALLPDLEDGPAFGVGGNGGAGGEVEIKPDHYDCSEEDILAVRAWVCV